MPLQVGAFCFASTVEAGSAACSQFVSSANISADGIRSVTCTGSDTSTGALNLRLAFTPFSTGVTTYTTYQQQQIFPPCNQFDYVLATTQIFGAFLALFAICYGAWQLVKFLNHSRGDHV